MSLTKFVTRIIACSLALAVGAGCAAGTEIQVDAPRATSATTGQEGACGKPAFLTSERVPMQSSPFNLFRDPAGNLWPASTRLARIDAVGDVTWLAQPDDRRNVMAVGGGGGIVWQALPIGHAVRRVEADQPREINVGGSPVALAVDSVGRVFVAESEGTLVVLDSQGVEHQRVSLPPSFKPSGVAVAGSAVWLVDADHGAAVLVQESGSVGWANPKKFDLGENSVPIGLTIAPDGHAWISDASGAILSINTVGEIRRVSAGLPPDSGPTGIALSPSGRVWVTLIRARKLAILEGDAFHLVDLPERAGRDSIGGPDGIVAGADGNVYFADSSLGAIGIVVPCHRD